MKKNEEYVVQILDQGFGGEGIAKISGQVVFVPNAIKGEKVKIQILKVTSQVCYAKIVEILEESPHRTLSQCDTYAQCGGCQIRHMDYESTLQMKQEAVENTLRKALGRPVKVEEVLGMENPFYYRNKLQYPVGVNEAGEPVMGVFAQRSHRIIPTLECKIQNRLAQKIANSVFDFAKKNGITAYNEKNQTGILRHIVIRTGQKTKEVMVTLVVNDLKIPQENALICFLTKEYPEIKTIVKNWNNRNTNVILGQTNEVMFGDGYITDELLGKKFKISNLSFYQVNPVQTEKLYAKAIEYAELTGNETIFDLYCGIGTIGICTCDKVSHIVGIESIPEAIEKAKENAKINQVEKAEFFVGEVEVVLPRLKQERDLQAEVVFVDPPRKGCDQMTLDTLLEIKPQRIVYVSCNPATLGRDLKVLEEKYELKKVAVCDMFPWTNHCEVIAALQISS